MTEGSERSDHGLVPDDWEVKPLSDLGLVKTGPFGTVLKAAEYSETEGVPLISVGEIKEAGFVISDRTPRIPADVAKRLPEYVLKRGDIVFGRKGAVDRSALVTEAEDGWFLGSDGIRIRPHEWCHPEYLALQIRSRQARNWLVLNAIGTTMASLNNGILSRLRVPIAPLEEQTEIARTIGGIDDLLQGLDRLIGKKRDLKQAAMQQLLTGQTRLPGFHRDWEVRCLGDYATFLRNGVNSRAELTEKGNVAYIHYGDIHLTSRVSLDIEASALPFLPASAAKSLDRLQDGDLVMVDASEDIEGVGKAIEICGLCYVSCG